MFLMTLLHVFWSVDSPGLKFTQYMQILWTTRHTVNFYGDIDDDAVFFWEFHHIVSLLLSLSSYEKDTQCLWQDSMLWLFNNLW